MKNFLTEVIQILLATVVFFVVLEMIFRLVGAPGASKFVETILIREDLTRNKPRGEIRIFTYGESTMYGSHYGPTSSPARWLEIYLKDYLPGLNMRVINFARNRQGSDFILKTFKDTLIYKPDLAVFYLGHNDFLSGNRKDHVAAEQNKYSHTIRRLLKKSYFLSGLYRLLLKAKLKIRGEPHIDKIEYDVIETPPRGIGSEFAVPKTEPFYWENIAFLKENVVQIADLGEQHETPLLFYEPVSNLKDFSPFYSTHLEGLDPGELEEWDTHYEAGRDFEKEGRRREAFRAYLRAYAIDDTYADLSFRLGKYYLDNLNFFKAKRFFEEARDNDAMAFRATGDIIDIFRSLQKTRSLILVDTETALRDTVPGGILGEPIIEDNVHFSLQGQALVAQAGALEIAKQGWIAPERSWKWNNIRSFEAIKEEIGIDEAYMISVYLKLVNYFGSRLNNRIRYAKKALELNPLHPRALRYLAWTYWLMGEREESIVLYRSLAILSPAALKEVFQARADIRKAYTEYKETIAE